MPTLPRRSLRRASASIQRLKRVIGGSRTLYAGVVSHCRMYFAEHGDVGTCSLRSQLLMAFHDDEHTDLCAADAAHRLAWLLDACMRDKHLDGRRLVEMGAIVDRAQKDADADASHKAVAAAPKKSRIIRITRGLPSTAGGRGPAGGGSTRDAHDGNESDEGGSISRVRDRADDMRSPVFLLGDLGMVLRDPAVLHIMLHEVVRTLEVVIEAQKVRPLFLHTCSMPLFCRLSVVGGVVSYVPSQAVSVS